MSADDDCTGNPWLAIPWQEYEGHMGDPSVGQLQMLSEVFAEVLREVRPRTVAVLGCATGNGFEHVDTAVTRVAVGIDVNPDYLAVACRRFGKSVAGLSLVCADLACFDLAPHSLDLVHAALVLEYVEPVGLIRRAARWLRPGGTLAVLLQLPSEHSGKVSATPFTSLRRLEGVMKLVEPTVVGTAASESGLVETRATTLVLDSGKSFFLARYRALGGDTG